jgi:hypothetical protein
MTTPSDHTPEQQLDALKKNIVSLEKIMYLFNGLTHDFVFLSNEMLGELIGDVNMRMAKAGYPLDIATVRTIEKSYLDKLEASQSAHQKKMFDIFFSDTPKSAAVTGGDAA